MEISFIRLGAMGLPILTNLLSFPETVNKVHVYNRTRAIADEFAAEKTSSTTEESQGGKVMVHDSPAEALAATKAGPDGRRIVVSIVSNDTALEAVCRSLHIQFRAGDIHLCLSTVSPRVVDAQESQCREKEAIFVSVQSLADLPWRLRGSSSWCHLATLAAWMPSCRY